MTPSSTGSRNDNDEGSHNCHPTKSNLRHFSEALGPAFGTHRNFYLSAVNSTIPQGILLAFVALGFFNFYTALAEATWLSGEYDDALKFKINSTNASEADDVLQPIRLGNGEWWYVGMLAATGFAVGLVKVIWNAAMPNYKIPNPTPGFLTDIRTLEAENVLLPIPMLICSALSIGLGASAGPEAALGLTGCTLGYCVFGQNRKKSNEPTASDMPMPPVPLVETQDGTEAAIPVTTTSTQANTIDSTSSQPASSCNSLWPDFPREPMFCSLDGIAAAFGALFPSQILSPILAVELGFAAWNQTGEFSHGLPEILFRSGLAASISYVIYTGLEDQTLLHQLQLPAAGYDVLAAVPPIDMLAAVIMGIVCGVIGLVAFFLMAGFHKLGQALEQKFDALGQKLGLPENVLGLLLTPTFGGAIVGMLCKYDPLLFSDGGDQLSTIISLGSELGVNHIVASGFLKLVAVSISLGFGFVGGQFFPLLYAGTCTGVAVHLLIEDVPAILSVSCCMAAVPCGILPVLFTATLLSSVMLALGGAGASAVFLACIVSFFTAGALGVIQKVLKKALAAEDQS